MQSPISSSQTCCVLIATIFVILSVVHPSMQAGDEDLKRASGQHNIMRFGRTAGHNIMRFGRAGHNIMHFGKRQEAAPSGGYAAVPASLVAAMNSAELGAGNDPLAAAYDGSDISDASQQQQPLLYTPYRRFNLNYNKKADNRDNVFMHFG